MRTCSAIITLTQGRGGTKQYPVQRVESYTTEQSVDNDADAFRLNIGDSDNKLRACLERDNEVRLNLFLSDLKGKLHPIFTGIVDQAQRTEDMTLAFNGRDTCSSLAVDSDALPGQFLKIMPKKLIQKRAAALGITHTSIANMSILQTVTTDGSESEWAFWYRIARMKGMYIWSDENGKLIIDKLGYALAPTYKFGIAPRGQNQAQWLQVENETFTSDKTRQRKALVYGEDAKKGRALVAQGIDVTIRNWKRKPLSITTSTTSKTVKDLKTEADDTIFESIVGAQEISLTVRDTGVLIRQNRMCQVNLPDQKISGIYFIVGVTRQGGPDGLMQIVRLREKGFALSKRIPTAPSLTKDASINRPVASIAAAIATLGTVRWPDAFVRATQEFGVPAGWDVAVFLTALLTLCQQESSFTNVREASSKGTSHVEWLPFDQWLNSPAIIDKNRSESQLEVDYQQTFANSAGNQFNPFYPDREAGVGPMQLTTLTYKQWADQFGWARKLSLGEYDGGRWNPESNIRAAAKAFVGKLQQSPPADPTNAKTIIIGFERWNGSGPAAVAYGQRAYAVFTGLLKQVQAQIATVAPVGANSTDGTFSVPSADGSHEINLPAGTPDDARKAINFCRARMGQPYKWGGTGPLYDCASLVTAGLASASAALRAVLDESREGHHGDTTYTLFDPRRFSSVSKDSLLPADLVFFDDKGMNSPEHVGMYLDDGLFIHDPHTGDFVKVSSLGEDWYRDNYAGARRVIQWPYRPGGQ